MTGVLLVFSWSATVLGAEEVRPPIQVMVGDNYYRPDTIRVRAGGAMRFDNEGGQPHSLTLIDHEDTLDQVYLRPGATFTFVLPAGLRPGTYPLGCNIHVDMRGTVVVEE